ncbi:NAD(P)/FAD-dependent oxidoreductase [Nocardia sp. NPDC058058]|uniref:NAD(P)/FAD-dependent oxidoreductase n=1 Tax=Nocardia sp. NPDC058058 TaxID=3346317 RepID=UPI0036DAD6CE
MRVDVVVIGGGAAGLSAATVLARARRTVVVVDGGEPRNAPAGHTHGFLSRDGVEPRQLLAAGRAEMVGYGGHFLSGLVTSIERSDGGFVIHTTDLVLTARVVLVATGLRDELPSIAGVREQWGIDVLHCPYCHGYEVRDSPIAVIGGENRPFTLHQAALVRQWSDDVIFFPNGIELTTQERHALLARDIRIDTEPVARIAVRAGRVHAVDLIDGRSVPRRTVFVGPTFLPRHELLKDLGCDLGENGWVTVDPTGLTNVAGVWAAGNVVDSPAQLIGAAAAGSRSAIAVNHYLLAQDIEYALTRNQPVG